MPKHVEVTVMNRYEWLTKLNTGLRKLPPQDREAAMEYYEEYFDEAGPENEQIVIEELGDPGNIARQILADHKAAGGSGWDPGETAGRYADAAKKTAKNVANEARDMAGDAVRKMKEPRNQEKAMDTTAKIVAIIVTVIVGSMTLGFYASAFVIGGLAAGAIAELEFAGMLILMGIALIFLGLAIFLTWLIVYLLRKTFGKEGRRGPGRPEGGMKTAEGVH
jgi:hypothetical protein